MKCPKCNYEIRTDDLVHYGQPMMITSTPDQDIKHGRDYNIGSLGIAHRWRSISVGKYRQISIRAKVADGRFLCEIDKISTGKFEAALYIFEFTDAWVICKTQDIRDWLMANKPEVRSNHDRSMTSGAYIPFSELPHIAISKAGSEYA